MDACSKIWGNSFFATLHLAIDNSTGNIVGGYFCKEETLLGYYQIFSQILHNYGIPIKIITDKRTVFTYKQLKNKDDDKDTLTQFGFACKTLVVCLESTSIPQKKGQIERANGTCEDRLSAELRIENITNIEDGNKYLINVFIPKFNEKFGEIISSGNNAFVPVEEDKIDYYLSIISRRQFDKGNSIGYKNEFCQAFRDKKFVCFENKTKCLVVVALNNEKFILVDDQIYEMKKLNKNLQSSLALDQLTPEKAKKTTRKPPIDHPWRLKNYDDFQQYFKTNYQVNNTG